MQQPPDVHRHVVVAADRGQREKPAVLAVVHRLKCSEDDHRVAQTGTQLFGRHVEHAALALCQRVEEGDSRPFELLQVHRADPAAALKQQQGGTRIGFRQVGGVLMLFRTQLQRGGEFHQSGGLVRRELLLQLRRDQRVEVDVAFEVG